MTDPETRTSAFQLYLHGVLFREWLIRSRGPLGKDEWKFLLFQAWGAKRAYWHLKRIENAQGDLFGGAA